MDGKKYQNWYKDIGALNIEQKTPVSGKTQPNKACSGRVGFCGTFWHFPTFEFFLLSSIIHARPHATNANRYAY